jgi:hypothetical protein
VPGFPRWPNPRQDRVSQGLLVPLCRRRRTTSATTSSFSSSSHLQLCNISQIAMGVPHSESLQTSNESDPIVINTRCIWSCSGPGRSFDLLGGGPVITAPSTISHRWNHAEGARGTARSNIRRPIAIKKVRTPKASLIGATR